MRASRVTYVGELGWEIYVPDRVRRRRVRRRSSEAANHIGLVLAGYHALNSLRMEKGYRHWGHDITPDDTPLEAGLGFAVAWDKPDGFIGKDALVRQREAGLSHTARAIRPRRLRQAAVPQRADLA